VCYRRRQNSRQRAALENDPRYCYDVDGRYCKQQRQYPRLLKPVQSTGDRPAPYQGFAAPGRTRNYGPALPAPPPPPPCLLGTDQYTAYTPVDAAGSLLGAAHPTSGVVPTSGLRISAGSDVTSRVTSAGGRRPYPAMPPVEHIYESPKFVRRSDGEDDNYDDDVSVGDSGSGMRCPTSRQMVFSGTSSAVVTTFQ